MSEKKSREPYPGAPTERGDRPLTDLQESVDNIIEIPSDCTCPLRPL
ncbi:hypothetical protein GCM10011577_35670 [Pseudarthrobacter polychromogenes]|uniref:Uncharacterized protein n=1 Tax=Pseudarthrobacter polychromogenes TaxID=1676 RepID=A0ABQ1XZI1_9MICC|nr:hypothetical protein GCM10011577_35670 [Pseudarthrobacter polychromogenes]